MPSTPALHLELLSRTWTLVDNLFSVYEAQAQLVNILDRQARIALAAAALKRGPTPPTEYFERIWAYNMLTEALTAGAFRPQGVTVDEYRALLTPLLARSTTELQRRFQQQHAFLTTYRDIVMAYRHGRAVFPIKLTLDGTTLHLERSTDTFTVFRGNTVTQLTMDDAYHEELARIRDLTARDLANLTALYDATRTMLESYLQYLEHPGDHRYEGPRPWILFTDPTTAAEERVASAYHRGA
ncbi:MAG: hypothetical protein M3167_00300 [Acidobacteriota bacterium]|nr:hypothetical protein [Acidobacteriota bacterium]